MDKDGGTSGGRREGRSVEGEEKIGKDFGLSLKGSGELLGGFKPGRDTI